MQLLGAARFNVIASMGWIIWAIASPTFAQAEYPADDRVNASGHVSCELDRWREVSALLEMAPAGDVQASGLRGVRVFTLDGYGRLMPAVSVLWRESEDRREGPIAVFGVRGLRAQSDTFVVRSLERSATYWAVERAEELIELARDADPELDHGDLPTRVDANGVEEITICVHGWSTVIEVFDDDRIQVLRRSACLSDDLFEAAFRFSELAVNGFAFCNHLDPEYYRNESARLARCLSLGGNRSAAAEVASLLDGPVRQSAGALATLTTPDFVLEWDQQARLTGSAARDDMAERLGDGDAWAQSLEGSGGSVWVSGSIESQGSVFAMRQTWTRDTAGAWRLSSMAVSPPVPQEE